ncbi:MAG TPA: DEAD/DEAH box helicase, partial [Mycobacteriales bacterium]|nr:DEAD/DEAH box helicase [Mycobacteriales bacterium]
MSDAPTQDQNDSTTPEEIELPDLTEVRAERAELAKGGPAFADLGVRPETVAALEKVGITHAFAIQELTLPIALKGEDLIGQARTGTGKTLGFGIPLLQRIQDTSEGADGLPQALCIVPTRELCVQVTGDLKDAGATRGIRTLAIYGGRAYEPQVEALRKGVDVVVGTPGRLIDLAQQGALRLGSVKVLVLDEADEMLDLGFLPDVERIVSRVPERRQTMLFSATMPGPIVTLARRFMTKPVHITAESPNENRVVPTTAQHIFRAHAMDKTEMLARILQARGRGLTMVFCRTKRTAQKVADDMSERGFAAAAVHGDLGQGAREQALRAFRSGKIDVLVATDVAARGIDVEGVTHVINYQCPDDEKTYLHRIGRTGRAGADGVAVTFVDWDEQHKWKLINDALSLPFPELPETYSTSAHLYEALDIPEGTKGRLPSAQRTRAGLAAEEVEDLGETGKRTSGGRGQAGARTPGSQTTRSGGAPRSGGDSGSRPPRTRNRTRGGGAALAAVGDDEAPPST